VPDHFFECSNDCGKGSALCSNGKLGTCEVLDVPVRACSTGCGPGQQDCQAGAWGKCEYVAGPRSCTNDCSRYDGDGVQYCTGDAWGACSVPRREDPCQSACGGGKKLCENGQWTACDAPQPLPPRLHATVRDFTPSTNADFERPEIHGSVDDRGVLLPDLGADGLPVFASTGPSITISGPASFNTFYRDTPGVNLTTTKDLQLVASPTEPGLFVYENYNFFPIDGQLFGNYSGFSHNYHFTLMVATEFVYVGGETFTFSGDDDMWVFINRRLAIDLGGVHEIETASVDLDEDSPYLRITPGNRYALHFFFAERRTIASNFTIRTSIADVGSCP
jgi:fibro-slime domain-containing protein